MKKLFEFFFGKKKEGKDKIKKHQSCDFGIKEFNKTKRSKEWVEEINLQQKGRGHGKPIPPEPPLPPIPPSLETGVILVVFDGYTVSGTSWNYGGQETISCDHSGLTLDEQDLVITILRKRFIGFNVIITTDEKVYYAASPNRRSILIYTETWEWYGQSGGVSFVNSFGTTDGISFVFTSLLGYNMKTTAEAGAHEAGHQCGCYHQSDWDTACNKIREYRLGVIMGVGYYVEEPLFVYGTSSKSCTDYQDDNSKIKNVLG